MKKKSPQHLESVLLPTFQIMGGKDSGPHDPTVNSGDKVIQVALSNIDTALQLGPR